MTRDPITDEIPVVEPTAAEQLTSDTKRGAYIIGGVVVLTLILSVVLIVSALTRSDEAGPETSGDLTELQSNAERIEEADINLDDIVEDPDAGLLQSLIDTDFFSQSGFSDDVVDRLNQQAQDQLDELAEDIPDIDVDLPDIDLDLPDVNLEIPDVEVPDVNLEDLERQTQDLIDQADLETVDDVRDAIGSLLN